MTIVTKMKKNNLIRKNYNMNGLKMILYQRNYKMKQKMIINYNLIRKNHNMNRFKMFLYQRNYKMKQRINIYKEWMLNNDNNEYLNKFI